MIDSNFTGSGTKLIDLLLTDNAWLQTLDDCVELGLPHRFIMVNLKCRPHLEKHLRILRIWHLKEIN